MVATDAHVDIQTLKARHPVGDVVEEAGVRLMGRGRVRQGVCPFHEETAPSFTVYGDSQRWYCFGCGDGGDVLDFVQQREGLTLPEAIRRLDGSPVQPTPAPSRHSRAQRAQPAATTPGTAVAASAHERDAAVLSAAARVYLRHMLRESTGREYVATRGIAFDTARHLGLGYATGRGLREQLLARGFGEERIQASGLFTDGGRERYANMVVVPDVGRHGRIGWLAGRAVAPDASPRFQALPGHRPAALGLSRLGHTPNWAVVAEGLFDWLALMQWGYPAVAALGTNGLERVASALRGCPRVFLAFDNDGPGHEATERLQGLLGRRAAPVSLPESIGDVAELATQRDGRAAFLRLLEQAARWARAGVFQTCRDQ